jgi:hypothetical protein
MRILPSLCTATDSTGKSAPAPVGFQYGYRADKPWWGKMKDPVKEIGDRILAATPNTETLIWVDFSVQDVFPPDPSKGDRVPPKK